MLLFLSFFLTGNNSRYGNRNGGGPMRTGFNRNQNGGGYQNRDRGFAGGYKKPYSNGQSNGYQRSFQKPAYNNQSGYQNGSAPYANAGYKPQTAYMVPPVQQ